MALALSPTGVTAQFENLPKLGDASGDELSPVAERRLGESIMRQVRRDGAYLDDAEFVDYLTRFAAPLLSTPAASGQSFEFFAIDDGSINAFALPGGFIGVHSGLIMASESESELAGVLAHEIGHVTQRHIARMLAQQKQVSLVTMAAMALSLLAARSNPQAAMGGVLSVVCLGG
jgi:predicted Zn-dependent protease